MKQENMIKLIIGLGNPDKQYENTYHNVGTLFLNYLKALNATPYTLLNSNVYMNESGVFVMKALKKNNTQPEELLIVHDDSDLIIGKYKLDFGHGAAGHHGVENAQEHLKTNNFWRLRIGIRPQEEKIRQKAEEFVLKKITAKDKAELEEVFAKAAKKLEELPQT